jgi:hypothetical protein
MNARPQKRRTTKTVTKAPTITAKHKSKKVLKSIISSYKKYYTCNYYKIKGIKTAKANNASPSAIASAIS